MKWGVLITLVGAGLIVAPAASGGGACSSERAAERAAAALVRADQHQVAVDHRALVRFERRAGQLGDAIGHAAARLGVNVRQESLREAFLAAHCQGAGAATHAACLAAAGDLELAVENEAANRAAIATMSAQRDAVLEQAAAARDELAAAHSQLAGDEAALADAKEALAACAHG